MTQHTCLKVELAKNVYFQLSSGRACTRTVLSFTRSGSTVQATRTGIPVMYNVTCLAAFRYYIYVYVCARVYERLCV